MLTQNQKERLYNIARQIETMANLLDDGDIYNTLFDIVDTIDSIAIDEKRD